MPCRCQDCRRRSCPGNLLTMRAQHRLPLAKQECVGWLKGQSPCDEARQPQTTESPSVKPHCRDEREIPYMGALPWSCALKTLFRPNQEVMLYSLRVAHWASTDTWLFWALSVEQHKYWKANTDSSFRKTPEPCFCLSSVTDPSWLRKFSSTIPEVAHPFDVLRSVNIQMLLAQSIYSKPIWNTPKLWTYTHYYI